MNRAFRVEWEYVAYEELTYPHITSLKIFTLFQNLILLLKMPTLWLTEARSCILFFFQHSLVDNLAQNVYGYRSHFFNLTSQIRLSGDQVFISNCSLFLYFFFFLFFFFFFIHHTHTHTETKKKGRDGTKMYWNIYTKMSVYNFVCANLTPFI